MTPNTYMTPKSVPFFQAVATAFSRSIKSRRSKSGVHSQQTTMTDKEKSTSLLTTNICIESKQYHKNYTIKMAVERVGASIKKDVRTYKEFNRSN